MKASDDAGRAVTVTMSVDQAKFDAAVALCAAADNFRLLAQCEIAAGRPMLTSADSLRLTDAQARWTVAKLGIMVTLSAAEATALKSELRRQRRAAKEGQ